MMMKSTIKRIVLTGAAVVVMMSFAAPAMALPNVGDGGPGVIGPVVDPPPPPPPNPLCDVTPIACGGNPPPVADKGCPDGQEKDKDDKCVPKQTNCPDGQEKDKDGKCTDAGGEPGGGEPGGGESGGGESGGGFSPISLMSKLPDSVAKTLPNTGGGWTVLGVAGAALIGGGTLLVRRFSS
jgi:LPXTG-motif cell wall-anchored protein